MRFVLKFPAAILAAVGMCLVVAGCAALPKGNAPEVRLNSIFSEHMVLQRDRPIRIFGTASPGGEVAVTLDGTERRVTADAQGGWTAEFPAQPAGGPLRLTVAGRNVQYDFRDILVGDVWFCSGQSNMEMMVRGSLNREQEIANSGNRLLRLLQVPKIAGRTPYAEPALEQPWQVCGPENVGDFSAAAYFFGRELTNRLNIPIGLVHASWGGSPVEHWMPAAMPGNPGEDAQLRKKAIETFRQRREKMQECYDFEDNVAAMKRLSAPALDDAKWGAIRLPEYWEKRILPDFDGIVQFRKTLELPKSWAGRPLELELGAIDETDVTFFNGEMIARRGNLRNRQVGYWRRPRFYRVPGKLVRPGKNVLSVFVGDLAGGGGLWGQSPMRINPVNAPDDAISLETEWKYRPVIAVPPYPKTLGNGYYSMVSPFFRMPIKGAIWYQGESNAGNPPKYLKNFPAMIRDWRKNWKNDFPFYFVQLANFKTGGVDNWARLRDAQRMTLDLVPGTGMASAIDIGEENDIHPRNKQEVGRRLALLALRNDYGRKELTAEGPRFDRAEFRGGKAIVRFRTGTVGKSLKIADGSREPTGFEVAGPDGKFHPAQAKIVGETVECAADGVDSPNAVRYLWSNNPRATLYNDAGLPAGSFSTEPLR